jgi:hypothetical protein
VPHLVVNSEQMVHDNSGTLFDPAK